MGYSMTVFCSIMSAELVWLCVRKNSSFLVKQDNRYFPSEPNNLTGKNSFRYSGLAQRKTVSLEKEAGEKTGMVLATKCKGKSRNPSSMHSKQFLKNDIRRVAKSIKKACAGYRPDLEKAALARATALFRIKRSEAIGVKPPQKRVRNKGEDDMD